MSHLVLPDVPPDVVEELRRRAERHGRPVEDEARAVLEEALGLSRARALAGARRLRAQIEERPWSDSATLLRKDRER